MNSGEHARPLGAHYLIPASKLGCMLYSFMRGHNLGKIGSDQRDQDIYGIRRTCQTSLSTYFDQSKQVCMHAHYRIACTGLYISQIWSNQRDQSIYGFRRICRTSLSKKFDPSMQACMHEHYVLACTGPYISQIGLNQRDQSIYGIRITCWTFLST